MYRKECGSMVTAQTQIRIDVDVKREAADLFPQYSHETLLAMEAARRISRDDSVPSYDSMEEFKRALES